MSAWRFISVSAAVLTLAACGPASEPEAADAPVMETEAAETAAMDTPPADTPEAADPAPAADPEESLHPLEVMAREVCAAGDEGFGALLTEGTGFISRGGDARVHAAWNLDGEVGESVIYTPDLPLEDRVVFDGAAADFLRRNLVAGVDRTGITGAFRYRDGRFCVVQTEREAIEALRDAVRTAEAVIDAQ
jgi:hypothetical protein